MQIYDNSRRKQSLLILLGKPFECFIFKLAKPTTSNDVTVLIRFYVSDRLISYNVNNKAEFVCKERMCISYKQVG